MNQQDPLAQLRDIHVPVPGGWWPPAPGWWLLALLVLTGVAAGLWLLYRRYQRNTYRRQAREEMEGAWRKLQQNGDRNSYVLTLSRILRRAARAAYPAHRVNGLQGEAWLDFLDETSVDQSGAFSRGAGRDLLTLPYRPVDEDCDLRPLHDLAMQWLDGHGPLTDRPQEVARAAV